MLRTTKTSLLILLGISISTSLLAGHIYIGRTDQIFSPNNISSFSVSSFKLGVNDSSSYTITNTSTIAKYKVHRLPKQNTLRITQCITSTGQAGVGRGVCNVQGNMTITVPDGEHRCLAIRFVQGSRGCGGDKCYPVYESSGTSSIPIFYVKLKGAARDSACKQFIVSG